MFLRRVNLLVKDGLEHYVKYYYSMSASANRRDMP